MNQQDTVLLTHGYFLYEDEKESAIMRPYVPLGLLYISAFLTENGVKNTVYDSTFKSPSDLFNRINTLKPKVVAVYTNLMTKLNVLKIIQYIRNNPDLSETRIVLGGPEVRHHASSFLQYGADYLVLGEGEETMLELTGAILEKADYERMLGIKGIAFKNKEGIVTTTSAREQIKDLNKLPLPARDKIDLNLYFEAWKKKHGHSALSVSTMRGCPYTCKWCSRAVYGQSYRRRSPAKVVEELKYLREKYHPDTIWFVDDVFTVSHKWLEEFATLVNKSDAVIPFECITRADRMNDMAISLLKQAGCFRVWIGAESGSQSVIDAMDRRVKVELVRDMIQRTRQQGMEAGTFIMLGYPGEKLSDIEETLHHLKVSSPDHYTITIAYPIKGTPLYTEVEPELLNHPDWDKSTDRDLDFKRSYPRQFYHHAVRYIANEVALHRRNGKILNFRYPLLKFKSWFSMYQMKKLSRV